MTNKTLLPITLLILSISFQSFAQTELRETARLKTSLTLTMDGGTNGTSVAFNPLEKVYYTVIAGNESFPIEMFDLKGNSVSGTSAGIDVRGMWWNPKTKSLEANGYSELGYFRMDVNSENALLGTATELVSGMNQPSEQSVGAFDPTKQQVLFYNEGIVSNYSLKDGKAGKKPLSLDIPVDFMDLNSTTLIYTGVKGFEYGLLNYTYGEVLFFTRKGGKYAGSVVLPENAPLYDFFRFSYSNGLVWLFNAELREWYGYEVFK